MNINTLKQEARELFTRAFRGHNFNAPARINLMDWNDTLIDRVVDAVEAAVVPKCLEANCDGAGTVAERDGDGDWTPAPCEFCHRERLHLIDAFKRFRNPDSV